MSDESLNPRWANYFRLKGYADHAAALEGERKRWPSGVMAGFITWNTGMIGRFYQGNKDAFCPSGGGVALTSEGHERYDAWLTTWVDTEIQRRQERMDADLMKISDARTWPRFPTLPVKTQPWVTEEAGTPRFGYIHFEDRVTVMDDSGRDGTTYDSIEELVKVWSVD